MKILVTGGNGFIAQNLYPFLQAAGHEVVTTTRTEKKTGCKNFAVGPLTQNTDWTQALEGVDCVIHLAARVHVMKETSADPLIEFMQANCHATKKLAETAKTVGVKKFIFISSIGVNGETTLSHPFSEKDTPLPGNPYAISKFEAEKELIKIKGNMDLIIIRPPLIYGPHCKGNFYSLLKLCKLSLPLPFGFCTQNKRNLLYIDNFSHFITHCLTFPGKTGLYLIADNKAISLAEIIKNIRVSMGMKPLLLPIPFIDNILGLIGKKDMAIKLMGSLELNTTKAQEDFSWQAPYSPEEGLRKTIEAISTPLLKEEEKSCVEFC